MNKRHLLWEKKCGWLCDRATIKEIPENEASISMICRWVQEILGRNFPIVHQSNIIMADVDALTMMLVKLIAQYCIIASILYSIDKK